MTTTENSGMTHSMQEAYEKYLVSKPYSVENERLRPKGQDIFEWLLEDKDLIHETDRDLRKAGIEW